MKWLALILVLVALPMEAKHKKQPLIKPDAPFSIEPDPRGARVHLYLEKKRVQLRTDLADYPGFKGLIDAIERDISGLELMDVGDPAYAEKFAQFHASLSSLWELEGRDAI